MRVAIGSKNPAKINAVKNVFKDEIISVDAESGVSEQPMSDEETIKGAINRAIQAAELGEAEIGIGLEGASSKLPMG